MATIYTGTGAKKFIKPDYIVATLFTGAESDDTPLGDSYVLEDVVEDTTSVSQDDNTTTDIECETSDSPIMSIVKLGKFQVAAEVGDTQSALLTSMCGFIKVGNKLCAPSNYKKLYCKFDIVFKTGESTMTAFVVPKLQLNSKITIESLSSNLGRIKLAGTAQDAKITHESTTVRTPFYVDENYTLPS